MIEADYVAALRHVKRNGWTVGPQTIINGAGCPLLPEVPGMSDVFGIGGIAQAAGSVASASIQASAQKDATDKASQAANKALDLAQGRYDTTRGDLSPFRTLGGDAASSLDSPTGIGTFGDTQDAGKFGSLLYNAGQALPGINSSDAIPSMTQAQLEQTPGYQFTLQQGLQATQSSAAARGLGVSGAALKGAATYATGLADNTYKDQFGIAQQQFADTVNQQQQLFGATADGIERLL